MRIAPIVLFLLSTHALASEHVVPTDVPTIQAAIDRAKDGDLVRVLPGLYRERINFQGRAIAVVSTHGAELTVIDGLWLGSVVRFDSGEDRRARLEGFTITHGRDAWHAGGVHIDNASPTLRNNRIVDNQGGAQGHGLSLLQSGAWLEGNVIASNRSVSGAHGAGGGGGIGIHGPGAVTLIGNQIVGNEVRYSGGGGIALVDAGPVWMVANTVQGNRARLHGAGLSVLGRSQIRIEQNLLVGNQLSEPGAGGGVYWQLYGGGRVELIGNTVADNQAERGSAVYADGSDADSTLINNLLLGVAERSTLECGDLGDLQPPRYQHNNVWGGIAYAGLCADVGANLSRKPEFERGYVPAAASAGVDQGDDTASMLAWDLAGAARVQDGNGDGRRQIDIGAFEARDVATKR